VLMEVEPLAGKPLGPEFPKFRFSNHSKSYPLLIKKR